MPRVCLYPAKSFGSYNVCFIIVHCLRSTLCVHGSMFCSAVTFNSNGNIQKSEIDGSIMVGVPSTSYFTCMHANDETRTIGLQQMHTMICKQKVSLCSGVHCIGCFVDRIGYGKPQNKDYRCLYLYLQPRGCLGNVFLKTLYFLYCMDTCTLCVQGTVVAIPSANFDHDHAYLSIIGTLLHVILR